MQELKEKLESGAFKTGVAIFLLICCFGLMVVCVHILQSKMWVASKVTLNDNLQTSLTEFSTALQTLMTAEASNEGRISADSLNRLYQECKAVEHAQESDGADYFYPAFQAQLGQIRATCAGLAQVEQGNGLSLAHLTKASKGYDEQLKTTLQRVEPERAAWASEQMQTLAKD